MARDALLLRIQRIGKAARRLAERRSRGRRRARDAVSGISKPTLITPDGI